MPDAPPKPCLAPRCPALVTGAARCPEHTTTDRPPERRGSAAARGYDARWRKLRRLHLNREPLCRHCLLIDRVTPATDVDHITPHTGHGDPLLYDPDNLRSLCHSCHSRVTARYVHHGALTPDEEAATNAR